MDSTRILKTAEETTDELASSLTPEEIEWLRSHLKGMSWEEWTQMRTLASNGVSAFLRQTPSQRRESGDWAGKFPILTLAAFHHCVEAWLFLGALTDYMSSPGHKTGNPQELVAAAGQAAQSVTYHAGTVRRWPFDGGDPFVYPSPEPPENIEDSA